MTFEETDTEQITRIDNEDIKGIICETTDGRLTRIELKHNSSNIELHFISCTDHGPNFSLLKVLEKTDEDKFIPLGLIDLTGKTVTSYQDFTE